MSRSHTTISVNLDWKQYEVTLDDKGNPWHVAVLVNSRGKRTTFRRIWCDTDGDLTAKAKAVLNVRGVSESIAYAMGWDKPAAVEPTLAPPAQAVEPVAELTAKSEAIANADAHLNNVGLPTYTELLASLGYVLKDMKAVRNEVAPSRLAVSIGVADDLIKRAS